MSSIIEQIKAEVERLENYYTSVEWYVEALLSFLSTLQEQPVCEELEDAVTNYIAPIENEDGLKVINFSGQDIKDAFIAGAKWQKEQMMKEAVEIEVVETCGIPSVWVKTAQLKAGDKVRIIILPKED